VTEGKPELGNKDEYRFTAVVVAVLKRSACPVGPVTPVTPVIPVVPVVPVVPVAPSRPPRFTV